MDFNSVSNTAEKGIISPSTKEAILCDGWTLGTVNQNTNVGCNNITIYLCFIYGKPIQVPF